MPVTKIEKNSEFLFWGVWKIEESAELLETIYTYDDEDRQDVMRTKHPAKRAERLSARAILAKVTEESGEKWNGLKKDTNGRPRLKGSDSDISITHAKGYAAAALTQQGKTGIDMERASAKVVRVRHKFLSQTESEMIGMDEMSLTAAWAAKEAIYKCSAIPGLEFKNEIIFEQFCPESKTYSLASARKTGPFRLSYQFIDDYVLCIATRA
ncbi:4'-phosphopantetheinyl transferase superfamily protein [Fulvitalea axinellae]